MGAYSDQVLATPGLLAYWQCNEAGPSPANLADSSGRGHAAVGDGSGVPPTYGVAGARASLGVAVRGNGGQTFWQAPDHADWADLTPDGSIEFWARIDGNGYGQVIGRPGSAVDANNDMAVWIESGVRWSYVTVAITPATTATSWPNQGDADALWHHRVYTWDPAVGIRKYIDGALVSTSALGTKRAVANVVNIGSPNAGFPFVGALQHMALYSRALTLAEIQAHYNEVPLPKGFAPRFW